MLNIIEAWLSFYGLSVQGCLIAITILLLSIAFMKSISALGYFKVPRLSEGIVKRSKILYLQQKGKYEVIYHHFEDMIEQSNKIFKISKHFAIFYDDPDIQRGSECRVTIGIMVNDGQISKINEFRENNSRYELGQLPDIKCQISEFPYFNSLSYMLIQDKIYPLIRQKINARKSQFVSSPFSMQIYNFIPSFGNKTVEVATIFEDSSKVDLWKH